MLVLRIAIVFSSEIRELMLNMVYGIKIENVSNRIFLAVCIKEQQEIFLIKCCYFSNDISTFLQKTILRKSSHGDWFMLSSIMDNMNAVVRSAFIKRLESDKKFLDY